MRDSFREKFWARVNKEGPVHPLLGTKCWLWVAGRFSGRTPEARYGQCYVSSTDGGKGQGQPAHRVAWKLEIGDPGDLSVLHRCDTPLCCRFDGHLFLGTQEDNVRDASTKSRIAHGSQNGNSSLSEEDVLQIRELHAKGAGLPQLSEQFKVSIPTVSTIVLGKTWTRVGGPVRALQERYRPPLALTEEQVTEILSLYKNGRTQQSLADQFGVSIMTIHNRIVPILGSQVSRRRRSPVLHE